MTQAYSDPSREDDDHALPDLDAIIKEEGIKGGWFYWYCFPGCLPDSEAIGPFASYNEALAAARENAE